MIDELEYLVDAAVFEAMRESSPKLVDAISDLLAQGQTPAQIEQRMVVKFGRRQATRNVRHAAEHLRRIG